MKRTGFLLLAALLLTAIAHQRPPEYDEAYSVFLTAGNARPAWPSGVFTAGDVRGLFTGHAGFAQISHDLKNGDVHPPLYFWLLEIWRRLSGPSWLAARLLSVIFSTAALAVIAWLAEAAEIPVLPALSLTLLSYAFAYTGTIARGFALAQFLNLLGFALIFQATRRHRQGHGHLLAFAGGLAFGAACFANYLAVFIAFATLFWLCLAQIRRRFLLPAALGLLPLILLDAPYFLAQRHSRTAQFISFSPIHALALLAKDSGAALFGGLPLYAGPAAIAVITALLILCLASLGYVIQRRHKHTARLALAALAPPCGLLALGLIFHNTPIEIRYLAFSMPFLALLLAAALPRALRLLLIAVESCAIIGLAFAPATMQPQALAARQIAALNTTGALVLLPFGNDGTGIPGPFIAAVPDTMQILLLHPGNMPNLPHAPTIFLVTLRADDASRTATAQALAYFSGNPCFKVNASTKLVTQILAREGKC
jgi:hypothetical protein